MTENSVSDQKRWQFQRGVSGNPAGKPKGAKNHATRMAERLFDGAAEEICRVVIDRAKKGDMTGAKLVVERLCPPRKDRPISLSKIKGAQDLFQAAIALLQSVAHGEVTPEEAGKARARRLRRANLRLGSPY